MSSIFVHLSGSLITVFTSSLEEVLTDATSRVIWTMRIIKRNASGNSTIRNTPTTTSSIRVVQLVNIRVVLLVSIRVVQLVIIRGSSWSTSGWSSWSTEWTNWSTSEWTSWSTEWTNWSTSEWSSWSPRGGVTRFVVSASSADDDVHLHVSSP